MDGFILILITLLLSGFFSGSEIAFVSANRLKIEIESRKSSLSSKALQYFSEKPELFLSTTLVGNNIINVLYATLMAIFLRTPIQEGYLYLFGVLPGTVLLLLIQTIIASVIITMFGEIIPKSIFRAQSDFLVKVISLPLRLFQVLFYPIIWISTVISNRMIRSFGVEEGEQAMIYRRQDIEMLFKELKDAGGGEDFDKEDSEILHNVLELSGKRVKESMIPRTEIEAVDEHATLQEVQQTFISSGYSKLPVYRDTIDDIIGVVFAYDLFSGPKTLKEIVRPVKMIPASKKAKDLLADFRQTNTSVAVVIDEYGGTAGLITAEDLIEEVVGDIQDEYDIEDEFIKKISDNTYMVSANIELDDLNESHPEIAIPFDENSEYETVAGYIIHLSGRIPKVNEELMIDGRKYIISKATPNRLDLIKIILLMEESD